MPRPHPPEFRHRAVEFSREGAKPVAQIAADLGIADSYLRKWLHPALLWSVFERPSGRNPKVCHPKDFPKRARSILAAQWAEARKVPGRPANLGDCGGLWKTGWTGEIGLRTRWLTIG